MIVFTKVNKEQFLGANKWHDTFGNNRQPSPYYTTLGLTITFNVNNTNLVYSPM